MHLNAGWPKELSPGLLTLLPGMSMWPTLPTPELFQPRAGKVLWDHLDWMCNWTQGQGSIETLRFRWVSVEVYSLNTQAKPCMSISLLTKTATCQSGVACLFPRLLHALRVLGSVSGLTWETLKIVWANTNTCSHAGVWFQASSNFVLLIAYFENRVPNFNRVQIFSLLFT